MQTALRCAQIFQCFHSQKTGWTQQCLFFQHSLIAATHLKEMGNLTSYLLQPEVIQLHRCPFIRTLSPLSEYLSLSGEWCLHSCSWKQCTLQPKMQNGGIDDDKSVIQWLGFSAERMWRDLSSFLIQDLYKENCMGCEVLMKKRSFIGII